MVLDAPFRTYLLSSPFFAGNKKGLLLPHTTTDQELLHIRNSLPVSAALTAQIDATRRWSRLPRVSSTFAFMNALLLSENIVRVFLVFT